MKLGITQTIDLGDGKIIEIETGKLAKQADGAVVVKSGGTMLLATVVSSKGAREGVDFLPLTVEYKEKFAAAGKIPGGFLRREARPNDAEILVCRLIDRALRPLFPSDYHAGTQVMIQMISSDGETMPDSLAGLAASACIAVSDIPFDGPLSEVRVARIDGKFVVNPSYTELQTADMNIIVGATMENIMMIEGEMNEASEADMLEAIKVGHEAVKIQCQAQIDLAAQVEKSKVKRTYSHETNDEDLRVAIKAACYQGCYDVAKQGNPSKVERKEGFSAVLAAYKETLSEDEIKTAGDLIGKYFHDVEKEAVRRVVLDEGVRLDGREMNQIRPIWSEVSYLPGAHGSAIFTRGETQSLTTLTLGTKRDEQMIDGVFISGTERFMLHYNFPPFSTGEERMNRGTSRREVGHGNLAQRALKPMIEAIPDNPYTVRIVSEILESSGSSSMATVCAGTLAMMDAGLQIPKPVSGIAMGLIADDKGKYAVLSDILGDEDHLGDMDFKVTGTKDGITACQMDIKVDGLSYDILEEAMNQAKEGRLHILAEMAKTIAETRPELQPHIPRIVSMIIAKDTIGALIGPGGKVIQELQAETGTTITVEEIDNKGKVSIAGENADIIEDTIKRIQGICGVVEIGKIYKGKVKAIQSYGAFVEILPGKDGLLHISEIEHRRLTDVSEVLTEGEIIEVKLIGVDDRGKIKLSRKALLPKPEAATATSAE
ncbi:MAG: polyribonucleotide nucleotidyltransferase [Flavobacteriales bacterium]|nr:polyribonucleotide nucleotidyltransferase [Flavobacteriales bacterium]